MRCICLLALFLPTSVFAQVTSDSFDFLDFEGNAVIEDATDHSAPPGYGPQVIHLRGEHVLGLAKGAQLASGTLVALYRELDPTDLDADGILVFGAQYGEDTEAAHNTKALLPHAWLEQDDDSGLHFRYVTVDGTEKTAGDQPGRGLVGNPWNVTGWIWQKVQIEEGHLRAKYWPAHKEEPEEWVIDTPFDAPTAGRIGFRIGSGDIHLAHFAWSEADIAIEPPQAWLFPDQPNLALTGEAVFRLFLRSETDGTGEFELHLADESGVVARHGFSQKLKTGYNEVQLSISTGDTSAPGAVTLAMDKNLVPGERTLSLTIKDGIEIASTRFAVRDEESLKKRIDLVTEGIQKIRQVLKGELTQQFVASFPDDYDEAMSQDLSELIADVSAAHLDDATGHLNQGDALAAVQALQYAEVALAEMRGFKGLYVNQFFRGLLDERWPSMPDSSVPPSERKHQFVYSPWEWLSEPRTVIEPVASAVMGRYVAVRGDLQCCSTPMNFRLELTSPLQTRIVASFNGSVTSDKPLWTSHVLQEIRESLQAQPAVLDEYHKLLISLTHPETGASYLLQPNKYRERLPVISPPDGPPGTAYGIGEMYVSSAPIKLEMQPWPNRTRCIATWLGSMELECDLALTVTAVNGEVLYQDMKPLRFEQREDINTISFRPDLNVTGPLLFNVKVLQNGQVLAEAKALNNYAHSRGTVMRGNAIVTNGLGSPRTSINISLDRSPAAPVHAQVYADGRLVGETTSSEETFTIEAEPWFGYYDVILDFGEFRHIERIIATVVETRDGQLLVNGEPFIIKGLNVHGMDASSPERTRNMMRIFKDLGFNMLRGDYPPRWEVDMAYEENLAWTVLAPYSCTDTDEIFARFDGPPMAAAREQTRIFIDRYVDSAGVLLWNSANEVEGDLTNFIRSLYPVYKHFDPYKRPVHYANLFAQNRWQGQDAMSINYYFNEGETPEARHPMILRDIKAAKEHGLPVFYTEFNSWHGAVHSSGVAAMEGLFDWGIEQGMCGGFFYYRFNSDRHPGVIDDGFNTHKLLNDALRKSFADAELTLVERTADHLQLELRNRRPFALRKLRLEGNVNGVSLEEQSFDNFAANETRMVSLPLPDQLPGPSLALEGHLHFETHHGFREAVTFRLYAE
jgi:hypothetical protein